MARKVAAVVVVVVASLSACRSRPKRTPPPPPRPMPVLVLPLVGPEGQVARGDATGTLTLLEGVAAAPVLDEDRGPVVEVDAATAAVFARFPETGVAVSGRYRPDGAGTAIAAELHDVATGAILATATIRLAIAPPSAPPLPAATGPAVAGLALASFPQLDRLGGFVQLEVADGPKGGWDEVFRRAFGGAVSAGETTATRMRSFPRPAHERQPGDDPRDDDPPATFGEEVDGGRTCRVMLQCRWAVPLTRRLVGAGLLANAHHCGWYSYIPGGDPERVGFHLAGETVPLLEPATGLLGWIEAWVFRSDRGWEEFHGTFRFLRYDSQRDGPAPACDLARCIRREALAYARLGARPYDIFGSSQPNSNSFLGAVAMACGLDGPPLPSYPDADRLTGWFYWRKGRDAFTPAQIHRDFTSHRN